jgi:hypothetical protein
MGLCGEVSIKLPFFLWDYVVKFLLKKMDVGQNGRPRGPQMDMSSLVLTIQLLGYLILTHTQIWLMIVSSLADCKKSPSDFIHHTD